MTNEKNSTEVSDLGTDVYFMLVEHGKKIRENTGKLQEELTSVAEGIAASEKKTAELKAREQEIKKAVQILKQKEVDNQGLVGEIERQKTHLKATIVAVLKK